MNKASRNPTKAAVEELRQLDQLSHPSQSRSERVKIAIKKLQAFHRLGENLPQKQAHEKDYGKGIIKNQEAKLQINEDTLRKARQFADPDQGYTREELKVLCRRIHAVQSVEPKPNRAKQSRVDRKRSIFERSHVVRLLTVPKKKRLALQEEAITQGWSTAQLEATIAQRFGTRRAGGRKRRVPSDAAALLTQLEGLCEHWRRWQKSRLQDQITLPKPIEATVQNICAEIFALQEKVVAALQAKQPLRQCRQPSPEHTESQTKPAAHRPRSRG